MLQYLQHEFSDRSTISTKHKFKFLFLAIHKIIYIATFFFYISIIPTHAQISGASNPPILTDTLPSPILVNAESPHIPGGASPLWQGNSFNFPAEPASPAWINQTYRSVAAKIDIPNNIVCTAGDAIVKAEVTVTNNGPHAGKAYSGQLALLTSTIQATLIPTPGEESTLNNTQPNTTNILKGTWSVPASSLTAGDYQIAVALETGQDDTRKSWTASGLKVSYEFTDPACSPKLKIDKSGALNDANNDNLANVGESIQYTFLVTNTGVTPMTDVTVDDPFLSSAGIAVTPGPQALPIGQSATFTATAAYPLTQADIDAGSVHNSARAKGNYFAGSHDSVPDNVTTPLNTDPKLTLQKSGLATNNQTVIFSFLVTNTGTTTLNNVTINDPLLANASVPITPGQTTLRPGEAVTFTATYSPTQAEIDSGAVTNSATATGESPLGVPIDSGTPSVATVKLAAIPAMTLVKTGTLNDLNGNKFINLGETITYSFHVTNTGGTTLTDVTVNDPLLADAGISVTPGPQTLQPGQSVTFTATYAPTQTDIDSGSVSNSATATATPPPGFPSNIPIESAPSTIVFEAEPGHLLLEKTGAYEDTDGDGYASVGDTITYTFKVTNDGPQTINNISPVDSGPTFNGAKAGGSLSAFQPEPVTLAPAQHQDFTATYKLTKIDLDNAAGLLDAIANSAVARGETTTKEVISNTSSSSITIPIATANDINVAKVADVSFARRGDQVPFTIRATKDGFGKTSTFSIIDTIPAGFRFVEGSASINDVEVTPEVTGREIRFSNVEFLDGSAVEIKLKLLALSTAGPGDHVNRAHAEGSSGNKISNDGNAAFTMMAEPVFDCGDIVGKVFNDRNRNGYQDQDEPGLPGARVTSVGGMHITTDKHGRFNVACADLPDGRIGSSYIMKLDPRSLPTGHRIISENPRVVRLTAGKVSQVNFATSLTRVVRLDLNGSAFLVGSTELSPIWHQGVSTLLATLEAEPSVLRIIYRDTASDKQLASQRLKQMRNMVAQRWKEKANRYRLEIEARLLTGSAIASSAE